MVNYLKTVREDLETQRRKYDDDKTYDVPFQGRVDYTVGVEASDPSEAITKARKMRNELNLKSEIYVNGWFDDECEDDVEEIDVVAEEASRREEDISVRRWMNLVMRNTSRTKTKSSKVRFNVEGRTHDLTQKNTENHIQNAKIEHSHLIERNSDEL